jgi:hypothetical protein
MLLVILLGAVESGRLSGVRSLGAGFQLNSDQGGLSLPQGNSTLNFWGINTTRADYPSSAPAGQLIGPPQFRPIPLYWWYLFVPIGLGAIAMLYMLMRSGMRRPKVFDFKRALEELEKQRAQLGETSWTGAMRNEMLLRYYSLMQKVCGRIGLHDRPAETPSEYLQRVANELEIDANQAKKFAEVFNRARYGLELTRDEVADASRFMGGFLDGIRSKVGIG